MAAVATTPYRCAVSLAYDVLLPRSTYSAVQPAESERIHRAWLNGEDAAPGTYHVAMEPPATPPASKTKD